MFQRFLYRQLEIISQKDLKPCPSYGDFFRSLFSPDINAAKSFGFHMLREKLIYREGYGL
jgi:hypothetical protein